MGRHVLAQILIQVTLLLYVGVFFGLEGSDPTRPDCFGSSRDQSSILKI